jgi:hypothetical protein
MKIGRFEYSSAACRREFPLFANSKNEMIERLSGSGGPGHRE